MEKADISRLQALLVEYSVDYKNDLTEQETYFFNKVLEILEVD